MNIRLDHFPLGTAGIYDTKAVAALGEPISGPADMQERMTLAMDRGISNGQITLERGQRRSDALVVDAAENFMTFTGQKLLAALVKEPSTTELMMPGPNQVVPVRQTLERGDIEIAYEVVRPTGTAGFVDPMGMQRLTQVGEYSELLRHRSDWTGCGYGWGMVELWQKSTNGRSLTTERPRTAQKTLRNFNERLGLNGDSTREIPGLLVNTQGYQHLMGPGFQTITDPDAGWRQLQIIDHSFSRAAQSFGGALTHVIAPKLDQYQLQRLRYGANGEGTQMLSEAMATLPWLRNIRWVDGLSDKSAQGGALWVGWSQDADELWHEVGAAPMMFGPFTDGGGLRTGFVLLTHVGGLINRRFERMARWNFTT